MGVAVIVAAAASPLSSAAKANTDDESAPAGDDLVASAATITHDLPLLYREGYTDAEHVAFSGLSFGVGTFNLVLSMVPPKMLKMISILGTPGYTYACGISH